MKRISENEVHLKNKIKTNIYGVFHRKKFSFLATKAVPVFVRCLTPCKSYISYSYQMGIDGSSSTRLESMTNGGVTTNYTYYANGNIDTINGDEIKNILVKLLEGQSNLETEVRKNSIKLESIEKKIDAIIKA